MLVEQNKLWLIESNSYGNIYISNDEIIKYIKDNINYFISFKIEINSIQIIDSSNFYPIIKVLINSKSKLDFILEKIDLVSNTLEMILTNNIGLKISGIQVGVKNIEQ